MEEDKIKELIASKVAEAKLEVAEKRLNFVLSFGGAMVAVFGIVLPMLIVNNIRQESIQLSKDIREESRANTGDLSNATTAIRSDVRADMDRQSRQLDNSAGRVDNAIQDMQTQFKELAGVLARKPVIECFADGASLEGAVLKLSRNEGNSSSKYINIKNTGDAPARVSVRLYTNISIRIYSPDIWSSLLASDEPAYSQAYKSEYFMLDPKESQTIKITKTNDDLAPDSYPAILMVHYEQPEPKKYSFTFSFDEK